MLADPPEWEPDEEPPAEVRSYLAAEPEVTS